MMQNPAKHLILKLTGTTQLPPHLPHLEWPAWVASSCSTLDLW